jgi:hypothetical protein
VTAVAVAVNIKTVKTAGLFLEPLKLLPSLARVSLRIARRKKGAQVYFFANKYHHYFSFARSFEQPLLGCSTNCSMILISWLTSDFLLNVQQFYIESESYRIVVFVTILTITNKKMS